MNCNDSIIVKECGKITIHVYRESNSNASFFYIRPDQEDLLPIVDILEDTLKLY